MPKKRRSGSAFTVEVPRPLPAEREGDHWWLELDTRTLRLSNLDKVFWPDEGYTKGDLLAYYYNAADLILPYLHERPLTMDRMPDGIDGPHFFEKNAPTHTPDWIPRCRVGSDEDEAQMGHNDFLMANELAGLLFVANLGAIEFHPLHSRCGDTDHPDYLFFDLDPHPPATFEDVLIVARHVRAALDSLDLPSYPKTSGKRGMQIYVGLDPRPTYGEARGFVGTIGRAIRDADPQRVTMLYEKAKRRGIYVDHNMNRRGANIAAAYSVRPWPGATVATPLTWDEIEEGDVRPEDFTIAGVHERFAKVGDLFEGMLTSPVDAREAMRAVGIPIHDQPSESGAPQESAASITSEKRRASPDRQSGSSTGEKRRGAPEERPLQSGGKGSSRRRAEGASGGATVTSDPQSMRKSPGRSSRGTGASKEASDARKLQEYDRKRDFQGTPEPPPGQVPGRGDSFVIQKHDATRLHYDLRLERDGVLVSWAVPRGLPLRAGDKRLAVQTEDHPLEYGSFEGWIPKGHYGAGEVRIFDKGTYEAPEWKDDKVTFRLEGSRHRGEYHLVKTRTDWLVFLSKASAGEQPEDPPALAPMLADPGHEPFDDPKWRYEPKLDGIRTLAYIGTEGTRLVSRRGRDQTELYPELNNLARFVNALQAVVDGEIVAADEEGRPSFERLQQRMNLASPRDIERARSKIPVMVFLFDLLWLDGRDITGEPLEDRRRLLEEIVTVTGPVGLTVTVDGAGRSLFDNVKKLGFEGVIAKRLGSQYLPGRRTKDWRKIKALNTQDCVILGWTPGTGSRGSTFGALLVGAYSEGELVWIGQVGTGFTDPMLADLQRKLDEVRATSPPISDPALRAVKGARWVRPELVCAVEYLQMTKVGKLRAPSFKGLRPDKAAADCILEPPAVATEGGLSGESALR